jgi:dihydrofolate reductase
MGKVCYDVSMSLDGFITAANPRPEAGTGDGGLQLFEWTNSADPRNRSLVESMMSTGAIIVGRFTYDLSIPYWGADGPMGAAGVPTFVVSQSLPQDVTGGGVYRFGNGVEAALEEAKKAAGDRDISIAGANVK